MMDTNAQVSSVISLVVALIVVLIVALVGAAVLEFTGAQSVALNETSYEQAANETVSPYECASFMGGCDGSLFRPMIVVGILIVIVGVIGRFANTETTDHEPSNVRDNPDAITVIQHKYVGGEIETEEQLERELEWYLYPKQNDGDDNE